MLYNDNARAEYDAAAPREITEWYDDYVRSLFDLTGRTDYGPELDAHGGTWFYSRDLLAMFRREYDARQDED